MNDLKIHDEIRKESLIFVKENMKVKLDGHDKHSHSYISPRISSEFMDCSMPMTFDSYSHCSLGCTYCFAYAQKTNNSSFSRKVHSVNPKHLIGAINGEPKGYRMNDFYKHFIQKRFLLHWGGMADPFCNFERNNRVGYELISQLAKTKYPTLFSFKGHTIMRPMYQKLFSRYAGNRSFAFQCSIISPSDEMSKRVEIGVPVTSERIKALKMLSDMGYYTILRLRPFIIGITDDGLMELLYKCKDAGIKAISTEFVAIDIRSNEGLLKRYKWLGELIGTKNTIKYFKALSPTERGGYMRLNRLVKENFVKRMYKFCIENDILFACSDPDFKELNQSGSCCGMPDIYDENPELCNWTKNQLSYHLKEARRLYHTKGRLQQLKFSEVFKPEEDTYLTELHFGQDHICVSDMSASERHTIHYLEVARRVWNNLRSPSNPRNYFHGKILPVRKDEHNDLVYTYTPSEYEERWKNEGINMEK
jgi:DNA repair photolyase